MALEMHKNSNSGNDHLLRESSVLGLSLTWYQCYLDIGTMTIEAAPHPITNGPFYIFLYFGPKMAFLDKDKIKLSLHS